MKDNKKRGRRTSVEKLEDCLLVIGKQIQPESVLRLRHSAQQSLPEWCGADTQITSDFTYEPRGWSEKHDLLVRTRHAVALTWLIFELRDAFAPWLDHRNKCGFFGTLAQTALQHLSDHQPEADDACPLLRAVLGAAFEFCNIVQSEGKIPANTQLVLHSCDDEGRQRRQDLTTGKDCV